MGWNLTSHFIYSLSLVKQYLNYEPDMNWPVTFNLSVNISVHLV